MERQRLAALPLVLLCVGAVPLCADTEHVIATGVNAYLDLDLKSNNQAGVAYNFFDSLNLRWLTRVKEVNGFQRDLGVGENPSSGYFLGPHFAYSPQDVPSLVYQAFSNLISSSRRKLQYEGGGATSNSTISDMASRDMALAFDAGGRPHVVYDLLNANFDFERWHATWDGSQWASARIEAPPLRVALAKGSMATDPQGDGVYAAYVVRPGGFTTPSTRTEFILARLSGSGSLLGRAVIDTGGARDVPGEVSSMKVDAQGTVHIAYTVEDDQRGTWELKYFAGGIAGGTVETLEQDFWPADKHTGVALALDTAGQPYIAYAFIDQTTNEQRLRVIQRDGPGTWTALAPLTQSAGVLDVDIAIGTDNVLQVAYMDLSDESIKLVQRPLGGGCKLNVTSFSQNNTLWDWHHYDHRYEKDRNGNYLVDANGNRIPSTINHYGCALTSLAMALNAAGANVNPGGLNSFMKQHGGYSGASVDWKPAVEAVSRDLYQNQLSLKWFDASSANSRRDLAAAERELEDIVCKKGHPAIVGVKLRPDPSLQAFLPGVPALGPNHFVLVIGKEGNRFVIVDPEHTDLRFDRSLITYLDHYYVNGGPVTNPYLAGFEIQGYVADPPGISGLDFAAMDVSLLLSDAAGRRTGLDLDSGERREEILQSAHYLNALEDDDTEEPPIESNQFIYITQPPEGIYYLFATPLKDGPFQITLRGAAQDGSPQPPVFLAGQADAGETEVYKIDFSAAPGAAPQAVRCEVSLTAPPAVSASSGLGAAACAAVVSDAALGEPAASATCSDVEVSRQGVPAGNAFPVGTTNVTYTAEDDFGTTATASQQVIVTDGTPPLLTLPPGIETRNDPSAAFAVLNPGEATANDNCVAWTLEALRSDGLSLPAPYPIGTTAITWTATDDAGNSTSGRQSIVVHDVERPVLSGLSVDKPVLWPPNHQMVDVTVAYEVTDNSGATPACSLSVASNEAVNGTGDGDTAPDWIVLDAHRLRLRAERSGRGNGRVYSVTVTCADAAGNSSTATVTVNVPKSRKADR